MALSDKHIRDVDLTRLVFLTKNDEDIEFVSNILRRNHHAKNLIKVSFGKYLIDHLCLLNKHAVAYDLLKRKVFY
jgi:hypothetical protein